MKPIFIPVVAAVALLTSCSDWTDPRNQDFLPRIAQEDPATLAAIRAFKASDHPLTMLHIDGPKEAPNRRNQHPMAMPDSVDLLLVNGVADLHPAFLREVAEVRAAKGTRTLGMVDYTTIRRRWEELRDEAVAADRGAEFTEEHFAAYCRTETERLLEACETAALDGVVASYLGGYDAAPAAPFVRAVDAWAQAHPERMLLFRGYPAYVARIEGQQLVGKSRYILILTEEARSSVAISRLVREQLVEGVPADRIILEAAVPALADGGEDAQVGATLQEAARWVTDPSTVATVRCEKRGLAVANASEDYFNNPTYRRIREAVAILNAAPADPAANPVN